MPRMTRSRVSKETKVEKHKELTPYHPTYLETVQGKFENLNSNLGI